MLGLSWPLAALEVPMIVPTGQLCFVRYLHSAELACREIDMAQVPEFASERDLGRRRHRAARQDRCNRCCGARRVWTTGTVGNAENSAPHGAAGRRSALPSSWRCQWQHVTSRLTEPITFICKASANAKRLLVACMIMLLCMFNAGEPDGELPKRGFAGRF